MLDKRGDAEWADGYARLKFWKKVGVEDIYLGLFAMYTVFELWPLTGKTPSEKRYMVVQRPQHTWHEHTLCPQSDSS